ncbi:MAG: site-2 protease family protein [Candidatus Peribacteria bacterium]|nr:MAG: site-2 protease family protein [Candidatus Peribacteria bacterium]
MFIFLVIIHELGHFTAAKKTGVKVLEFGLGIPPKFRTLWKDASGTEYTCNWIPLGGFVRLKGENPNDTEDFNAPDSFIKASLLNKLIILIAGVTVNALFAWIAFSASFMVGVYPINVIPESMIQGESRSYLMPTRGFLEEK